MNPIHRQRQKLNHEWRMFMINYYLINRETSALYSYFYKGYEYSRVIEGEDTFLVSQSPEEIIKQSFLYLGSNLRGAIEANRLILKKVYKVPVALSAQNNIILIKCTSANKESTIWLINSHIKDIQPYRVNQTKVYLTGGHFLLVDMKLNPFQDKRNQAAFIHKILLERSTMSTNTVFL